MKMTDEERRKFIENAEIKLANDYRRNRMKRFKPVTDSISKNFDNDEYQWMFASTENEKDGITVTGHSAPEFVADYTIGTMAHLLNNKEMDAVSFFRHFFNELDDDIIACAHYAIHGKLPL